MSNTGDFLPDLSRGWQFRGDTFDTRQTFINRYLEFDSRPTTPAEPFSWRTNIAILAPDGEKSDARLFAEHLKCTSGFIQTPRVNREAIVIIVLRTGRMELRFKRGRVIVSPGQAVAYQPSDLECGTCVPLDGVFEYVWAKASLVFAQQAMADMLQLPIEKQLGIEPMLDLNNRKARLLSDFIGMLGSESFTTSSHDLSNRLQKKIIETFMQLLLESVGHRYSERLVEKKSGPLPGYIRVARDYIRHNAMKDFTVVDIAKAAGVSIRTLEGGFRAYFDASPSAYHRYIRLQLARDTLMQPQQRRSVAEVARLFGFYHLGRFSQYYAQRFGETPSQTRRGANQMVSDEDISHSI